MTDIKELALRVARETFTQDEHGFPDNVLWEEITNFAQRFLAAYLAEQEPHGYVDAEQFARWNTLRGTEFESAERCYLPFSRTPYKSDMTDCSLPIFTAPPLPEPAPQQTAKQRYDKLTEGDAPQSPIEALRFFCLLAMNEQDWLDVEPFFDALNPVCAAPYQDAIQIAHEAGFAGTSWTMGPEELAHLLKVARKRAAPSSEEVREMVERLRAYSICTVSNNDAADLIERLAARVPDGCVVVPRKATAEIRTALRASVRRDWPSDELCNVRWAAAIAAGEIKP